MYKYDAIRHLLLWKTANVSIGNSLGDLFRLTEKKVTPMAIVDKLRDNNVHIQR